MLYERIPDIFYERRTKNVIIPAKDLHHHPVFLDGKILPPYIRKAGVKAYGYYMRDPLPAEPGTIIIKDMKDALRKEYTISYRGTNVRVRSRQYKGRRVDTEFCGQNAMKRATDYVDKNIKTKLNV